jgi:hypothetical protein
MLLSDLRREQTPYHWIKGGKGDKHNCSNLQDKYAMILFVREFNAL